MSSQTINEQMEKIRETLNQLQKKVEVIEDHDIRKLYKDLSDVFDHLTALYNNDIEFRKRFNAITKYVKQLKQVIINLHEGQLTYEDIENMFPDDNLLGDPQ
jgi:Asp-tRNA(Asn)/Glu-tRNA(Gln) amidotransferase C subunit